MRYATVATTRPGRDLRGIWATLSPPCHPAGLRSCGIRRPPGHRRAGPGRRCRRTR